MKKVIKWIIPILEILLSPLILFGALFFRTARFNFFSYFPVTRYICRKCGMIPVIDHYYYPLIDEKKYICDEGLRKLESINFNIKTQLEYLDSFLYQEELGEIQSENSIN